MLNGKYMNTKTLAIRIIKKSEGWREKPYHCTQGFVTIGFGRKICDIKNAPLPAITTTKKAEETYLSNLVDNIISQLESRFKRQWASLSDVRKAVLISMVYQLGWTGFLGFRKTILAIEASDFKTASAEMLNSLAAKQAPNRWRRNSNMMLTDNLDVYYEGK